MSNQHEKAAAAATAAMAVLLFSNSNSKFSQNILSKLCVELVLRPLSFSFNGWAKSTVRTWLQWHEAETVLPSLLLCKNRTNFISIQKHSPTLADEFIPFAFWLSSTSAWHREREYKGCFLGGRSVKYRIKSGTFAPSVVFAKQFWLNRNVCELLLRVNVNEIKKNWWVPETTLSFFDPGCFLFFFGGGGRGFV